MLFLTVLVIALGWAGWFWAWGRDRYVSGSNLGLPPNPFAAAPTSPWSAPNNRAGARLRRRQGDWDAGGVHAVRLCDRTSLGSYVGAHRGKSHLLGLVRVGRVSLGERGLWTHARIGSAALWTGT